MSIFDHSSFLSRLKNSGITFGVFYDVGANIGSWSYEIQKIFPAARFELFEPLCGRYPELNHKNNFLKIKKYGLHNVALSDESGWVKMKVLDIRGEGSTLLILDSDFRKDTKFIEVEQVKMDEYVIENKLIYPDFIKLDTQASELKILKGATKCLRYSKMILIETWARRVYGPETPLFQEIAHFMYNNNYLLYDFLSLEEGRDADGTLRWFDAVFINRDFSNFPKHML